MTHNPYLYILFAALTTYAIRVLPLTLIRKPIKSRFVTSFLHYVPYVTLAVMTFPAILSTTGDALIGWITLAVGVAVGLLGGNSFVGAVACSIVALLLLIL